MEKQPVSPGMITACESEVGDWKNVANAVRRILCDFAKLVDLNAPFKVMAYRVPVGREAATYDSLGASFENILKRAIGVRANEFWLFIGVPWTATTWPGIAKVDARVHILAGERKEDFCLERQTW
jgi:hypothetical protein